MSYNLHVAPAHPIHGLEVIHSSTFSQTLIFVSTTGGYVYQLLQAFYLSICSTQKIKLGLHGGKQFILIIAGSSAFLHQKGPSVMPVLIFLLGREAALFCFSKSTSLPQRETQTVKRGGVRQWWLACLLVHQTVCVVAILCVCLQVCARYLHGTALTYRMAALKCQFVLCMLPGRMFRLTEHVNWRSCSEIAAYLLTLQPDYHNSKPHYLSLILEIITHHCNCCSLGAVRVLVKK